MEAPPPTAIVVSGDEEIRSLLRGLLKLQKFRVLGEATGPTEGLELLRNQSPALLVVDASLPSGAAPGLLAEARRVSPGTRTLFVAPGGSTPALPDGMADVVLLRPFRLQEFADAVGVATGSAPG